jgi:hypothetical protein
MGEPAMTSSSGFRTGIQEVARQVGSVGLVDSIPDARPDTGPGRGKRRSWFGRRS